VIVMAQRSRGRLIAAAFLFGIAALSACGRPPERGSEEEAEQRDRSGRDERRDERRSERDERREESQIETRDLQVQDFDSIDFRGTAEIQITIGPAASVQITGSSRVLKAVKTDVHGDTLDIEVSKGRYWFSDTGKLKIVVTAPTLKSLESNGAGEIDINGFAGGEHKLRLAGAHNVKATGSLESLRIELEGAGNVDFGGVPTTDAKIEVSGAGNVEVNVSQSLRGEVNGVGAIRYTGNPQKVESELHGLGTISAK
jgi:hypothetical protein